MACCNGDLTESVVLVQTSLYLPNCQALLSALLFLGACLECCCRDLSADWGLDRTLVNAIEEQTKACRYRANATGVTHGLKRRIAPNQAANAPVKLHHRHHWALGSANPHPQWSTGSALAAVPCWVSSVWGRLLKSSLLPGCRCSSGLVHLSTNRLVMSPGGPRSLPRAPDVNMDKVETRISRLLQQLLQVPLPSILALPVIILVPVGTSPYWYCCTWWHGIVILLAPLTSPLLVLISTVPPPRSSSHLPFPPRCRWLDKNWFQTSFHFFLRPTSLGSESLERSRALLIHHASISQRSS